VAENLLKVLAKSSQIIGDKFFCRHIISWRGSHRIWESFCQYHTATALGRVELELKPLVSLPVIRNLETPLVVLSIVL